MKTYGDFLLLGAQRLLKVLVFLQQSLHAVQGVPQVFVQQEGLDATRTQSFIWFMQIHSLLITV